MQGVSIIICAYNSGKKLEPTLAYLSRQTTNPGLLLELIIVDNACTDNSIQLAEQAWLKAGNPFPLRIIKEAKAGLNFARIAGIKAARNEYLILCDDDNWLDTEYALKVIAHFKAMPQVAVIGGVGEAVSDVPLPAWFHSVNGFGYAVGTEGRKTGFVDSVYGAGMALRKSAFLVAINSRDFILTDRKGKSLSSGGDSEICQVIKEAGYKIYLDESMRFRHYLSKERLSWPYYLKLRKSFGQATALLQRQNNNVPTTGKWRSRLSLLKFGSKNIQCLLAPRHFKNTNCADFVQEWSRRKSLLSLS